MILYRKQFLNILCVLLSSLAIMGCKKEKTTWDTQIKAPIMTTSLKLENLLTSEQIKSNPDSSLTLVFENQLADLTATDVFKLPDTTVDFGSSLKSLKLPDNTISVEISLGQIAANDATLGPFIISQNGNSFPALPSLNSLTSNPIEIDNSSVFESMDIKSGFLDIIITNGLPVDIKDVNIEVKNQTENATDPIGAESFPLIPAGTEKLQTIDLSGKIVTAQLLAQITNFSTNVSSGPVIIDTSDAIVAKVTLRDIVPNSATALWPDQDLIDSTSLVTISQSNGVMIKEMKVKEGTIDVEVFSSLEDSMFVTYSVPNLVKDGQGLVLDVAIGPAIGGSYASKTASFSFNGYEFKMNGFGIESIVGKDLNNNGGFDQDTINAYVQNVKVRIQSTGEMKTISQSDTVFIKAKIKEIVPDYISGFMGNETIELGPETIDFGSFSKHLGGHIALENSEMNVVIENGIGAPAELKIESLIGKNGTNNTSIPLSGEAVNNTYTLPSATSSGNDYSPIVTTSTAIKLSNSNSNTSDFISNLPNSITYEIKATLNNNLTAPSYTDVINAPPNFIYNDYGFNSKINVEIPLSLVADNLILVDTIDFSYRNENTGFTETTFTLAVQNGFGFDATVNLVLLGENDNVTDTLFSDGFIARSIVDELTGKTVTTTKSLIHFDVGPIKLAALKSSSKIKAIIKLHSYDLTSDSKKYHKIFSSDSFGLKLIGSAVYNFKF